MGEVTKIDTGANAPQVGNQNAPTPDQAAAMASQAKSGVFRASAEPAPKAADRPEWLPEKFKTPEDMAKSYAELEKKLGQPKAPGEAPKPEAKKEPPPKAPGDLKLPTEGDAAKTEATKAVESVGLQMDVFEKEFAEKGELSPESFSALEKAGIPKAMVDAYIAGQQALADRRMNELHAVAGGAEKFDEMFEWSKANLPAKDRDALNRAIDSNDDGQIKLAFQAVHAKWVASESQEPQVALRGGSAGGSPIDVYTHMDEVKADMATKDYKTNEAFRAKVAAKIARSRI